MPYALDNGAFSAFVHKTEWDCARWLRLLEWARMSAFAPTWVLVPDVVGDAKGTIRKWEFWEPHVTRYSWPLAFAVQDGMLAEDVPDNADVVFVGGSTKWKWDTMAYWAERFPRVHVGRVNSPKRLYECAAHGVKSVDGTGWVINPNGPQWAGLVKFLEDTWRTT